MREAGSGHHRATQRWAPSVRGLFGLLSVTYRVKYAQKLPGTETVRIHIQGQR
jgi:hypothetical protein